MAVFPSNILRIAGHHLLWPASPPRSDQLAVRIYCTTDVCPDNAGHSIPHAHSATWRDGDHRAKCSWLFPSLLGLRQVAHMRPPVRPAPADDVVTGPGRLPDCDFLPPIPCDVFADEGISSVHVHRGIG